MKKCNICKKTKEERLFYPNKRKKDGLFSECKNCTKKRVKNRYNNPESFEKIKEYETKRRQTKNRKKWLAEFQRKRRKENRNKYRIYSLIGDRKRAGKLIKEPCVICGETKVEAHHPDYRRPLYIVWVCMKHHKEIHKNFETIIKNNPTILKKPNKK